MEFSVNGSPAPRREIAIRDMNFGQEVPGASTSALIISVDMDEFIDSCSFIYRDFAEDDLVHGEPDEEDSLLEMRKVGWPSLKEAVISHSRTTERLFNRWMRFDLLCALLESSQMPGVANFVINDVASIEIEGNKIRFHCAGINTGAPNNL